MSFDAAGETPSLYAANPHASYLAYQSEIDAAVARVLHSSAYILGPEVNAFEQELADYLQAAHCVGVASGTDALELALRALAIGVGDIVFTVSHTSGATVAAIEAVGALPVLIDVDPITYTMDVEDLAAAVTFWRGKAGAEGKRPKAILPVHLYGHPAPMPQILQLSKEHDLKVVEDCAQAHGAKLNGQMVGTFGDVAAFSFYPTKNLGAIGDGGAVVTADACLHERLRRLRQYGWEQANYSLERGINSRLDELQAAILRVKLRYLDDDNARRREIAAHFNQAFAGLSAVLPSSLAGAQHVYHQYVIRSGQRDALKSHLALHGVQAGIHYPWAVHQQPAYVGRFPCGPKQLAATETICREILSLPVYPQLLPVQIQRIAQAVNSFSR
jgi:dTDP-4-amino-4,6-dideoxygalactose transaminase